MAYKTETLFKEAVKQIQKHKLIFIEDVISYLPCSKPTFYDHFPTNSNDFNTLKGLIDDNKVVIKSSLRSKWYNSNNPTLQLALYKLSATPEELKLLQMQHIDIKSDDKPIVPEIRVYNSAPPLATSEAEVEAKYDIKE